MFLLDTAQSGWLQIAPVYAARLGCCVHFAPCQETGLLALKKVASLQVVHALFYLSEVVVNGENLLLVAGFVDRCFENLIDLFLDSFQVRLQSSLKFADLLLYKILQVLSFLLEK